MQSIWFARIISTEQQPKSCSELVKIDLTKSQANMAFDCCKSDSCIGIPGAPSWVFFRKEPKKGPFFTILGEFWNKIGFFGFLSEQKETLRTNSYQRLSRSSTKVTKALLTPISIVNTNTNTAVQTNLIPIFVVCTWKSILCGSINNKNPSAAA